MSGRIATYPAAVAYEAAWNATPLQTFPPPLWTDISARALGPWSTEHGTDYWLASTTAGLYRPVLDNRDGGLDPGNSAGPYAPNVAPYRGARVRLHFNPNLLTADQASAGEASGLLGSLPLADLNVSNDFGYPLSIVTSGTAFAGTQVYQAVLPSGATTNGTVLLLKGAPVIPRQPYSFQAQCRINSGNSVSTQVSILWYDNLGNSLGAVSGTAQSITSGSSTWIQLAVSATAPAGAFSAQLKVQIASGTLTGSTTWQVDGLQWEQSATPTTWQLPGTLGANLLPQPIATGSASIDPTKDSAANYFASAAGSLAQATNLTAAPNGATTAVAWTTPSGTTSSSPLYAGVVASGSLDGPVADCTQVTAGLAYSASVYLMRASSADVTVQVRVAVHWFNSSGALISTSSGTAVTVPVGSWVRASAANLTAPAGAVWGRVRFAITSPASTTATNVIYATGWQFEQAAAASTWSDPGPTFFAWSGFYEQLPQVWRLSGTWGELDAVGVDLLAGFAQYTVQDPLIEELLTLDPTFLYPLNDPSGSTSCVDATGNRIPAPVENSPFGAGGLTFGNGVTSATTAGAMQGSAGPVATFNNNPAGAGSSVQEAETFVAIHETTGTPGPPSSGNWTRIVHFRSSTAPTSGQGYALWEALPQTALIAANGSYFDMGISVSGFAQLAVAGQTGTGVEYAGALPNLCDGNWHQFAISCDGSGNVKMYIDGSAVTPNQNAGNTVVTLPITNITSDVLGASIQIGANLYRAGVVGDMACAAEFPTVLTATQITTLYNSFRNASSGESSGARAKRLLGWIGYAGPTAIDSGSTQTMGPASDLTGRSGLDAFNAVVQTESGDGYASNSGALTFKARSARYNSSPVFVFGENTAFGEWPYSGGDGELLLPTDPVNVYNIIPTQQTSTGQVATARDASSQASNFPRTFPTRAINSTSFAEVQAAGQYLLSQLKTPRMRLASMTLDLTAVPGLFRVAAQLEKGVRIRVYKRPPWRSTAIQFDGFVERLEWTLDPRSGGRALLRVEASPADPATYWTLAPLHVTLNAQALSGQNQATINALPDAAYNKLAQSLAQGQQFTFEPGTPRQETMTVSPTGVPSTSLGYTSATLTFTTNFAFTHAANTVVTEPLPSGYTDATTWDANSVLGVSYTTVVSGGASGTNTVTVGALQDAAYNPLGSNWNEGDQITLSPGTANAETVTILSVASTVPGYTSCQITLTANLAHSHAAGDYVCDPLPSGVTSPTAVAATTRVSY